MKLFIAIVLLGCLFAGCGRKEPPPAREQVESPALDAPRPIAEPDTPPPPTTAAPETSKGYFDVMIDARHQAKDLAALQPARQCVDAFKAIEGRLPRDIDELKAAGLALPNPPAGKQWSYDSETGEVNLAPAN